MAGGNNNILMIGGLAISAYFIYRGLSGGQGQQQASFMPGNEIDNSTMEPAQAVEVIEEAPIPLPAPPPQPVRTPVSVPIVKATTPVYDPRPAAKTVMVNNKPVSVRTIQNTALKSMGIKTSTAPSREGAIRGIGNVCMD